MSKKTKSCILAFVLVIGICLFSAYRFIRFLMDEEQRISYTQVFAIDSDTILQDLKVGKPGVFVLQDSDKYKPMDLGEPVEWSLEDYKFIAEVFHELTFGESLDDWQLSGLFFSWDCEHFDKGPQEALFRHIKIEKIRERESRFVSEVHIEPRRNVLIGGKIEFYPRYFRWKVVDPAKTIGVEEALQIAEANGGSDFRASVDNVCEVRASYFPENHLAFNGWEVSYENDSPGVVDKYYYIDPKTGEVVTYKEP
jgi:hypothetical protein